MAKVIVDISNFSLNPCEKFLCLILIELQDALHLYFHKSEYIITCNVTYEVWLKRSKLLIDKSDSRIHIWSLLKFLFLIYSLLDKYTFKARKE